MDASKLLQARDGDVAAVYADHGRIVETTSTTMIDTIVDTWFNDISDGYDTLVVADNTATAADVSAACQQGLHTAGLLGDDVGSGADANTIRVGDLIQTRHNDASLVTSDGRRVLNRDTWTITGITAAGGVQAAVAIATPPNTSPTTTSPVTSCWPTAPPSPAPKAAPSTPGMFSSHRTRRPRRCMSA